MKNLTPEQLIERFSSHLKNVVAKAMALATSLEQAEVTPLHLLLTLQEEQGSVAAEILRQYQIKTDYLYRLADNQPRLRRPAGKTALATLPELNPVSRRTLERAMLIAYERSHAHVGTEHLLLGLLHSHDADIEKIFKQFNISKKEIEKQVENILRSASNFPDLDDVSQIMDQLEETFGRESSPSQLAVGSGLPKFKKTTLSALDIFTTNLTDKRVQQNIDPVIGREREIERVINILSRRTKNNPVLVGEPGVGKTAIVEGLAKKISQGQVPAVLRGKKVLALDMTLLIAGTIYRGEFEARLKQVIDEIAKSPDCLLFIDELHNIIGAGSSAGAMDAANILKPALARGQLRCIGATTIDEYKKHLGTDPALERRFQAVRIQEPNSEETKAILAGVKKHYEDFHQAKISAEAINAAVELSAKYIHDNFQPDKALDLLDEACAHVRGRQKPNPLREQRQKMLEELADCDRRKEEAIAAEKFALALEHKKQAEKIAGQIEKLDKQISRSKKPAMMKVEKKDIARVLANRQNIPEDILLADEWAELETLPARLKKRIVGQDEAVEKIADNLKRAHLGLNNKPRTLASFLFVGPSGVGKTELAKILAQELYHDPQALIKLDMSEFSESHSTAKLLGSPAGYIGHKERNQFTDEIRQRPYCVVLFDEIDKAHCDVTKLLLQVLDEGELTDSAGKKTYFNHAIVILTTNLGAELFKSAGIGFGKDQQNTNDRDRSLTAKLKEELSGALINRLDSVIVFSPLSQTAVKEIIRQQLSDISQQLEAGQKISLRAADSAVRQLLAEAFNEEEGARRVERQVREVVQNLVAEIMRRPTRQSSYTLVKKKKYELV